MLSKMQLQLRVGLSNLSSPSQNYDHFSSFFKHGQLDLFVFFKDGENFLDDFWEKGIIRVGIFGFSEEKI